MDKYTLLALLNIPFVIFGLTKTIIMYKTGIIPRLGTFMRLVFWILIGLGLIFAKPAYDYLTRVGLTDSAPLTLFDIVEITGISFCIFLLMRVYARNSTIEQRMARLHRELSIRFNKAD
jgi:hypothetical protein